MGVLKDGRVALGLLPTLAVKNESQPEDAELGSTPSASGDWQDLESYCIIDQQTVSCASQDVIRLDDQLSPNVMVDEAERSLEVKVPDVIVDKSVPASTAVSTVKRPSKVHWVDRTILWLKLLAGTLYIVGSIGYYPQLNPDGSVLGYRIGRWSYCTGSTILFMCGTRGFAKHLIAKALITNVKVQKQKKHTFARWSSILRAMLSDFLCWIYLFSLGASGFYLLGIGFYSAGQSAAGTWAFIVGSISYVMCGVVEGMQLLLGWKAGEESVATQWRRKLAHGLSDVAAGCLFLLGSVYLLPSYFASPGGALMVANGFLIGSVMYFLTVCDHMYLLYKAQG